MGFNLMDEHTFEIDTTGGSATPTYAPIAKGIKNVGPKNDEKLAQDTYLDGNGFGTTDVIGAQLTLSFSGDRDYDDVAQNYIVGLMLTIGSSRRTKFRWTEPDGGKFEGEVTIANIEGPAGDAGAKGEIKFEIHFNGAPVYTAGI